uniref:Ig-like domain-containing protein n=1 Tax=Lates calcarifer TaxID=8187 RepID=A0A4W6DP14_LATCA
HIVEVQPGEEITLLCPNISKQESVTEWFRLISKTKISCVSSMYKSNDKASFCDGFQNRFEMSSNITTVFLQIKRVDFSDSGLYFCGFYINAHTVFANTVHLNVQGKIVFKSKLFQTCLYLIIFTVNCISNSVNDLCPIELQVASNSRFRQAGSHDSPL